jgi:signal transduction histidine kinase
VADLAGVRAGLLERICRCRPEPAGGELADLCRAVAEALDLRGCAILTPDGPRAHWPSDWWPSPSVLAGSTGSADDPGLDLRRPIGIAAGGRPLGVLVLEPAPLWRASSGRRRLVADVADALGSVLVAAALRRELEEQTAAARDHAERIGAARRVAFAERDAERRQLERDLHDGAQHHLVALRLALGLLELQLEQDRSGEPHAGEPVDGVAALRERIASAEKVLLDTAAGVCPPVLVDHGLFEALLAEFRDEHDRVKVGAPESVAGRRYPLNVETAVYFTCLEAVNNAFKHAPQASVTVTLDDDGRQLTFAVTDDGPGLAGPGGADGPGSFGLGNMRDRVVAAGGRLEVTSAPGAGTVVGGVVPI